MFNLIFIKITFISFNKHARNQVDNLFSYVPYNESSRHKKFFILNGDIQRIKDGKRVERKRRTSQF